jgi:hypothetical protein
MTARSTMLTMLLALVTPAVAQAGGLHPTASPPIDPDEAAALILRDDAPGEGGRFAWGGRFGGDLDGDGRDDIVLQSPGDDELEIWFGDVDWAEGQTDDNEAGDTTLALPPGCRQEGRIVYAGLGDLDHDGFDDLGAACAGVAGDLDGEPFQGAFALWFGRPQPWGGSVSDPDVLVVGTPIEYDVALEPISGERPGGSIGPAGDLDDDGYDDFVVTGERVAEEGVPLAWIFHGSAGLSAALDGLDDATWTLAGSTTLRCLAPLEARGTGDIDGDDLGDLAIGCPVQPPPDPFHPELENESDISWSVWLGSALTGLAPGAVDFDSRSFAWAPGQRVPQVGPFSAVGDLDGDGFDDVSIVSWFEVGHSLSGQILHGHAAPWSDVDILAPWTPFMPGEDYEHPEGLQITRAGPFPGSDVGVWLRMGHDDEARIGLLVDVDPSTWADLEQPPVTVLISTPGDADPGEDWRLGLGGPGDADGDGVDDLLIVAGFENEDGCDAGSCGGAWLLLCGDLDGDGVSLCAGDCDDDDPTISPALSEQCDAIDHDCDGSTGETDVDGDGFLVCSGDCDDSDPLRFPGAEETCDHSVDMDCDSLAPQDDRDADGAVNCEDCQPWDGAIHPGADEVCDTLDDDCDGQLPPDEQDIDQDGWTGCSMSGGAVDCDDLNPWVHPVRFEDCGNGVDDDCNGEVDEDRDADGDGVRTCEGDCSDDDPTVFPGALEACDGLDNNCNGQVDDGRDMDSDGFSECEGDCDDLAPEVHPGAMGVCEPGLDSNCDGLDDLFDQDGDGFTACSGDCDDTDPGIGPVARDFCDRRDNDCDGAPDAPWDVDTDGWASCHGDCADGDSGRHPQVAEPDCTDGLDGDCDGIADIQENVDCPVVDTPPQLGPRPYGIACSDCQGSVASSRGSLAVVALFVLALIRRRRRRGAGLVLGLLGLCVLLPATADAARKEEGLLVYLAPQPDLSGMVETRELGPASGVDPQEVLHSSELLDVHDDVLLVHGAAVFSWCLSDAQPPMLSSSVDAALNALIELDYRGAGEVLDAAIESLSCLSGPLPRRIMQNLFYYRGIAREGGGDRVGAEEDFRHALGIQPDYPGDPNFPPEVNDILERLRGSMHTWPKIELQAYAPGSTAVRLDGQDWDAAEGPASVHVGTHVVQFRRGRTTWTTAFELVEGNRPVVIHSEDRERALRDCVLDRAAREWAAAVVGMASLDAGFDLGGMVDLVVEPGQLRWLYRPSIDRFDFEDGYLDASGRQASGSGRGGRGGRTSGTRDGRSGRTGGSAGTTAGGGDTSGGTDHGGAGTSGGGSSGTVTVKPGASGGGAVAEVEDRVRVRISAGYGYMHSFHYVHVPLDFGVRLVAGLFIDVGLEAGIAGPSDHGTVLLPTASLGASYRIPLGVFQPRLGAVGRIALDSSPSDGDRMGVKGGWAGRVGFDIVPEDLALLLGFDVQAGMLGEPFWLSAAFGVGARF